MDKDNRDDFTFAKLSDLKFPVTFRMWVRLRLLYRNLQLINIYSSQLEGTRHPRPFTELLEKPDLRFHGVQQP